MKKGTTQTDTSGHAAKASTLGKQNQTSAEFEDPDPTVVDRLGLTKYHDTHRGRFGNIKLKLKGGTQPDYPIFVTNDSQREAQKSLVPLSPPEEVVPPSLDDFQVEQSSLPRNGYRLENVQQIDSLCDDLHQISPAISLLPDLLQASGAAAAARDPTFGEHIALGRVLDQTNRKRAGVIAVVSGSRGTLVRFNLLEKYNFVVEDTGEDEEHTSWKIVRGSNGWWDHRNTPIRQLAFSQEAGDFGEYLAVRFQQSVALLRPGYLKHPTRAYADLTKFGEDSPKSSFVDPRYFAEIQAQDLSGEIFADTAFNSVKQEIAVIDISGHWAIWSYHYENKTDPLNQKHPTLNFRNWLGGDGAYVSDYDGWARIAWTRDARFLLVARRRNALCYDTRNKHHSIRIPPLVAAYDWSEKDWIVDVKQCPLRRSAWWVLTTKRVISLSSTDEPVLIWGVEQGPVVIDISEQHFGDSEDLNVSLEVVDLDGTLLVIMRGKQDVPIWSHTFSVAATDNRFRVLSGNTSRFMLDAGLDRSQINDETSREPMSGMVLLPMFKSQQWPKDAFPEKRGSSTKLLRILLCSERHGVIEQLFSYQSLTKDVATIEAVIPSRSRSSSITSVKSANDSFVVDDAELSEDPDELHGPRWKLHDYQRLLLTKYWPKLDLLVIDRLLKGSEGCYVSSGIAPEISPSQTVQAATDHSARDILADASRGRSELEPGTHTMLEAIGPIAYDDFLDLSNSLRSLLQDTSEGIPNAQLRYQSTLSTTAASTSGLSSFLTRPQAMHDLPTLHSALRKSGLGSTSDVPGEETQNAFSQLLRHVALECFLSSHRMTIAVAPETLGPNDSAQEHPATSIEHNQDAPTSSLSNDGAAPSSSLPPIPDSDDVYRPGSGPDNDPALPVRERHPYPRLASLGIIGPVTRPTTGLDVVREQWRLGTEATGEGWRQNQIPEPGRAAQQQRPTSSQTTQGTMRPKTAAVPPRPVAERGSQLRAFSSQAAPAWDASQAGSQLLSSQSLPRASHMLPQASHTLPQASQRFSSQATLPAGSQFRSSQPQRVKKRKAGF